MKGGGVMSSPPFLKKCKNLFSDKIFIQLDYVTRQDCPDTLFPVLFSFVVCVYFE